jgi:ABC-type multidrug transport system permease subunit
MSILFGMASMVFAVLVFAAGLMALVVLFFSSTNSGLIFNLVLLSPLMFLGAHIMSLRITKWLMLKERKYSSPVEFSKLTIT